MHAINQMGQKISIRIENVVATASLDKRLNLEKIIRNIPNVQYVPKRFPGGIMRMKSPKSVILFFSTGKLVCTGTTSVTLANDALEEFTRILRGYTGDVTLSGVKIRNIVSSANLGRKVHLEQAARTLPRSLYEPEQFPGIIHRHHYPKTVILLFASGKLVCTEGKTTDDIHDSIHSFNSLLNEKELLIEE